MKDSATLCRFSVIMVGVISVSLIFLAICNLLPAFALLYPSIPALTVDTNNDTYAADKPVVVSGKVSGEHRSLSGGLDTVSVEVFDPAGKRYLSVFTDLTEDNSYSYRFQFSDSNPKGEYQILVSYYNAEAVKIINFGENVLKPDDFHTYVIRIDSDNATTYHTVRYKLSEGIELNRIVADTGERVIGVIVNESEQTGKGQLTIELPRSLIDSRQDSGNDKDYVITIGRFGAGRGYTDAFREIENTADTRTLAIDLLGSSSDQGNNITLVRIRGTQIVPEFSSIWMISILAAVGIGGILLMSRNSR